MPSRHESASSLPQQDARALAEGVRSLCVATALQAYEDAATAGLCHEGAWEAAVDAIRALDLEALLPPRQPPTDDQGAGSQDG